MPLIITELTSLSPNPKNYLLYHNIIDGKDLFSLKNKNIEGDNHFTFKPLNEISINNVVFSTAQELISAFNVNFNLGESTPQTSDHTQLTNIGANTHAQIDTHIGNKQNSLTVDGTGAKYPTVDAVNSALSSITIPTLQQVTGQGAFTDVPIEIITIGAVALDVSSDVGYAFIAGCTNGTAGIFNSNNTAILCRANNVAGRFEITTGNTIADFVKGTVSQVSILGNGSINSKKLLVNTTDNSVDIIQANGSILGTAFKKSGDTNANILLAGGGVTPLILNQTAVANATNAGRLRYYVSGAFSILECCMQTGASNYQWILISQQEIL